MTVPPAVGGTPRLPYSRLLCPVDFSDSSLAALKFAFSIAKEADAQLTILNVLDWPADDELLVEQVDTPALRRVVEEKARARLEALVTDDARQWCTPKTALRYGKPYRQILEVAEQEKSDLIVVGVRGRHAPDLAIFGSTTNHLVRQASCPVLTLKR
jgi:nucleotide-binding universal stress UspA family protein